MLGSYMPRSSQQAGIRPNIIYIMADDLGYGDVGFNGQDKIRTPHLDAMARSGVVFTNHYAGSPVCGPSRSCLLTGTDTGHTRVRGNPGWTSSHKDVTLQDDDITIAEELKAAGYTTAVIGKWGMDEAGSAAQANNQGFDYFFGYRRHGDAHHYYPKSLWKNREEVPYPANIPEKTTGQYSHDLFANEALGFIERQAQTQQPFFLYLAFTTPHYELTVPAESREPYERLDWPKRPMAQGHYYHDPEGNASYAGMVSRMDGDVGRIMDKLAQLGIAENTLVIFTSDNGPVYDKGFFDSNWKFRGQKRDTYEGGIHVPFVAVWPGTIPAGRRSDHVSAFWDFYPTACEVAGIKPRSKVLNGLSYLDALLGKKQRSHDYLYWEFNENAGPRQALRQGDWKLVRYYQQPDELYNLRQDISESQNIAASQPQKLKQLQALMARARTPDPNYELIRLKQAKADSP